MDKGVPPLHIAEPFQLLQVEGASLYAPLSQLKSIYRKNNKI